MDSALSTGGEEHFESLVCGIDYDYTDFGRIDYTNQSTATYCGTKRYGEVTTGRYIDISDEYSSDCHPWIGETDLSTIDSTPDNDETVSCVAKRYFQAFNLKGESVSNIDLKVGGTYKAYSGFGIWEDYLAEEISTYGDSGPLEILFFEQRASTLLSGIVATVSLSSLLSF